MKKIFTLAIAMIAMLSVANAQTITSDGWISWGLCDYTDDIMLALKNADYGFEKWDACEVVTYKVELQEKYDEPGRYRLVNPYGAAYPYNEPGDWDDSQNYYMELNATDPDCVYMELFLTGMDWGWGDIYIWDMAGFYMYMFEYSFAYVKRNDLGGTLKDGEITFKQDYVLICMPDWRSNNNDGLLSYWYMGNYHEGCKVVLPEAAWEAHEALGVAAPSVEPTYSFSNGQAHLAGLKAGASVYVYTATGQQVGSAKANAEGSAVIDFAPLKKGAVYLLRTPEKTFKVVY